MRISDLPDETEIYCAACENEMPHSLEIDANIEVVAICLFCKHFIKLPIDDLASQIALHGAHNL